MFGLEIFGKLGDFRKEVSDLLVHFTEGSPGMKEKVKNLNDYLQLNTRIAVGIKGSEYAGIYDSRVEDITPKHILISHPTDGAVPVPMLPDSKLSVEYVTNDGRFYFDSTVQGRHTEGSLSFIKINIPETITRNQLREFFRVSTNIRAKMKIYYSKVPDRNMKIPHKKVDCKVVDLSGGGGKLITDSYFEKGQSFGLDLSGDIEGVDSIICTCIRSKRIMEKTEISFSFNFEKESERNQIIKYVFKRQIELKQLIG